jgi:hypothetical protein
MRKRRETASKENHFARKAKWYSAQKSKKKQRDRQEGVLLNGVVMLRQGVRVLQGDAAVIKQRLCRYGWLCNDGG